MRVLMTHGASDPVLPAVASGWARDLLVQGGASVVAKNHAGGHDLGGPDVLQAIAEFVRSSIPGAACAPGTSCGPGG
jgi:predicted esterase